MISSSRYNSLEICGSLWWQSTCSQLYSRRPEAVRGEDQDTPRSLVLYMIAAMLIPAHRKRGTRTAPYRESSEALRISGNLRRRSLQRGRVGKLKRRFFERCRPSKETSRLLLPHFERRLEIVQHCESDVSFKAVPSSGIRIAKENEIS